MKKFLLAGAGLALLGVSATVTVLAQPPQDDRPPGDDRPAGPPEGRRGERGPGGPGRPPMPNPLVAALDTNNDREISAEELQAATTSLLTLDKNKDGKLTDDEMRPPRPERGPGGGRGDRPFGRDGAERGDGPPGHGRGGRGDGPPGDGPPGRGPMGPPDPERFAEHALEFDADGDGKLDRSELMKFAEQISHRAERSAGRGGLGPRDGRPGDGPPPEEEQDGERPDRPDDK